MQIQNRKYVGWRVLGWCWILLWFSAGCGGASTSLKTRESTTSNESAHTTFNPLEDLLGQAQSALRDLEDPAPEAEAVVRFVIFTAGLLPQTEATLESLMSAHFKLTARALQSNNVDKLAISKLSDRFSVTHLSARDELPINLHAFAGSAQKQRADLSSLKGLTFVSYQGHALRDGLQLKITCEVTAKLAASRVLKPAAQDGVWIASLATLDVLDLATFTQRCQDQSERWIRPGAELIGQEVRVISRGLNQWGRPELELGPLSKDQAPKMYPRFLRAMEAARAGSFPQKTLENAQLGPCLRPPHHYETSCRRLTW